MASSLSVPFILALILATDLTLGDITDRTNKKCSSICTGESARVAQSHQGDCQRGCRYFNIEFLTAATFEVDVDESKTELTNVLEQSRRLCKDAYPSDGLRRDACELGSRKMFEIQSKAPVASGGLLVYMGAGDRSMIVIQPPDMLESGGAQDNDWVLLNSFRPPSHDYELASTYKLTETHVQTMPISEHGHRFGEYRRLHTPFCIPAWLWLIPVMLLMALVYIQYGTTLKNVMVEESEDELEQEGLEQGKNSDGEEVVLQFKDKDAFLVSFQPLKFIEEKLQDLPPKYDEHDEKEKEENENENEYSLLL